jgi:hypothetical protein
MISGPLGHIYIIFMVTVELHPFDDQSTLKRKCEYVHILFPILVIDEIYQTTQPKGGPDNYL